jgi:hypothetical protein
MKIMWCFNTFTPEINATTLNKKFREELIAYIPWYYKDHIENDASNNSSIVASVFVTAVMFLPSRWLASIKLFLPSRCLERIRRFLPSHCLATLRGFLPSRCLATIGGIRRHTHKHSDPTSQRNFLPAFVLSCVVSGLATSWSPP